MHYFQPLSCMFLHFNPVSFGLSLDGYFSPQRRCICINIHPQNLANESVSQRHCLCGKVEAKSNFFSQGASVTALTGSPSAENSKCPHVAIMDAAFKLTCYTMIQGSIHSYIISVQSRYRVVNTCPGEFIIFYFRCSKIKIVFFIIILIKN